MSAPTYVAQGGAAAVTHGDVLILHVSSDVTGIGNAPAGWTEIASIQTGGGISCRTWYRISTGSETGTQTVNVTSGTKGVAGWTREFRDLHPSAYP